LTLGDQSGEIDSSEQKEEPVGTRWRWDDFLEGGSNMVLRDAASPFCLYPPKLELKINSLVTSSRHGLDNLEESFPPSPADPKLLSEEREEERVNISFVDRRLSIVLYRRASSS
jgi:hypothetical protein